MPKKTYTKKYLVNGEKVPGVTTVIKGNLGWGTQALIGWAVKVTKEGKDHRAVMQEAADAGTLAHTMVEHYVNTLLAVSNESDVDVSDYSKEQVVAASNAFSAFEMWLKGSNLKLIGTELEVVHDKLLYGGTIDLLMKDESGNIHIADVKTTNYLLPDHLIQVAAYANAYEHNYPDKTVSCGHLLRFSKGNATTFHHTQWSKEAIGLGVKAFTNLLGLQSLKKSIDGAC